MKIFKLTLLALVTLVASVAHSDNSSLPVLIMDKTNAIRIHAPAGWYVTPSTVATVKWQIEREGPYAHINFIVNDSAQFPQTLTDQDLDALVNAVKGSVPNFQLTGKQVVTGPGDWTGWVEYKGGIPNDTKNLVLRYRQYAMKRGAKVYIITITALDQDWSQATPYCKQVIDGLEFWKGQ